MKKLSIFLTLLLMVGIVGIIYAEGQIDIAYSPFTISQPGSYIVVKDLSTDTNLNCITVVCENVSIDLNGHTLYGAGTTAGYDGSGIYSQGPGNISITNGRICNFRVYGINLMDCNNVSIIKVAAMKNGLAGIYIFGHGNVYRDNILEGNGTDGLFAYSGCMVINNIARNNGECGINAVYDNLIKDNMASNNKKDGIYADFGNQIIGNTINNNSNATYGRGINIQTSGNRIDSNQIVGNRIGIYFGDSGNWYGRNTFKYNSSGNTSGSAPSDPGSPYTNQSF